MVQRYLQNALNAYYKLPKEVLLLYFFGLLICLLLLRLFFLQVVEGKYYKELLLSQHYTRSELKADRGQIFLTDKAGKNLQLTENVTFFNLFIDPKFVGDKQRLVEILSPIVYQHFCVIYGLETPDKLNCIANIEAFTNTTILPEREGVFVTSGGAQFYVDDQEYEDQVAQVVSGFTQDQAERLIQTKLTNSIQQGIKEQNYIGFFDDSALLDELQNTVNFPYVRVQNNYYVYIVPNEIIGSPATKAKELHQLLLQYGYFVDSDKIRALMEPQEIRYVRLLTDMNAKVAKMIKDAKTEYFDVTVRGVPLLHGLGLEEYQVRYYPFGQFMANVLGYVDRNGRPHYGVEEYFSEDLAGTEGRIIGLATPWIGQVGANEFEIQQPKDGVDIYLTIDPVIQKEVELIAEEFQRRLRSDSIAITILDPHTGKVKGLVNYPRFDLNEYKEVYKLKPLSYEERYLVDDLSYNEIPIFIVSGDDLRIGYADERIDPTLPKYLFKNYLGPQVEIDKNIGFPYEPGSIFKAITLAIGIDSDSLSMYDFYNDPGSVKVGPFTISNVSEQCAGDNTFMHALAFSCNVGMVRIAQRINKYVFYTYLEKLGFGRRTGIELAGEEPGTLPDFNTVSVARYFNNTYGQGLLATPLQMAVAYAALVNDGYYIPPTIVEAVYDAQRETFQELSAKSGKKIFKTSTSIQLKEALINVITDGNLPALYKPGYSLGGKTGTSEIAYKGKYQGGIGWTNGSFVGMVTADSTNYVVSIQVRRPRSTQWGSLSAGEIFREIADFLLAYDNIES